MSDGAGDGVGDGDAGGKRGGDGKTQEGSDGSRSGTNDETESFADLVGDTKPIARGPARIERTTIPKKRPGTRGGTEPTTRFRRPDPEEPRLGAASGVSDAQLFALGRGDPEPEEKIDLHGLRRDAAPRLLADRVQSAQARGLRCVVVVHGRGKGSGTGEAILREAVPGWLSKNPTAQHVLAFAPAPDRLGGEGAMLVLLRRVRQD